MRDLDQRISEWRKAMLSVVEIEVVDELENHLRESVDHYLQSGVSEQEAFQRAAYDVGRPEAIGSEFQKLRSRPWLPVRVMSVLGAVSAVGVVGWAAVMAGRFDPTPNNFLLLGHVVALTTGYCAALLLGCLGVCYVCQNSFTESAPARRRDAMKGSFILTSVALVFSSLGLVLGMVWANHALERLWEGHPRETGALCVVIWLLAMAVLHRFSWVNFHRLMALSILGNCVVLAAWFGPVYFDSRYGPGTPGWFIALMSIHLALFMLGLTPMTRWRRRRA